MVPDDILHRIATYADHHARAEACRAKASDTTYGPDRVNLTARADYWAEQATVELTGIAERLYNDLPLAVYATPDAFRPVHLPAPDLRHIEVRGIINGERTVTITFRLPQAVTAAVTMIALAGLANDSAGHPLTALVRPLGQGTGAA